jgi:RNA polymerase sigma-70 factor (sigma-E family)
LDDVGFHEFIRSRLGSLSRVAYLLAGDHHAAQDLLQNALIKVASHWERVSRAGDPMAYVRRVLYHEHVSGWRRDRHLRAEYSTETLPEPDGGRDEAGDVVRRVLLERALARLTTRQRALIVLRYFEDTSEAETAQILGIAIGSVKSQTSHALRRLRDLAPELADLVRETRGTS